jgi:endonuclease-3
VRRPADPARAWAKKLARTRPGLLPFVLDGLSAYGRPTWARVHDPTSELVLTILSQNSADVNAEHAFESLRRAFPRSATSRIMPRSDWPRVGGSDPGTDDASDVEPAADPTRITRPGWGGIGLESADPPDWDAVENAPIEELVEAIRPGGLANQKAPRIQSALRTIREHRGDHSLEFLGDLPALEARAWLTTIDGIGRKTASVVLLFAFGTPLMPVDRHVERVSLRIGLIPPKVTADDAHELFLAMLEPDLMYEAHVNLISHGRRTCHARRPACDACPVAPRCRFLDRRAP